MSAATETIQHLAAEACAAFETSTRPDGSSFVRVRDGAPDWVGEMVRAVHLGAAHGLMLPDDWRYETTREACAWIAEEANASEATRERFPENMESEFADARVDVYTGALIAWLGSNLQRAAYCDEAAEEYGAPSGGVVERIALGQYAEAREVFGLVHAYLRDCAEERTS